MKKHIDQTCAYPFLKSPKEHFEKSLSAFFCIPGDSKGKAQKLLFQLVLILEVLVNKLLAIDRFRLLHLISKLSKMGEDVNVYTDQYNTIDPFSDKGLSLYFELLQKLISFKNKTQKQNDSKEETKEAKI